MLLSKAWLRSRNVGYSEPLPVRVRWNEIVTF
jgi:hypothetical protein